MIDVWTYRVTGEEPDAALLDLLSPEERRRHSAFHFEKHRREFLCAHAVNRLALSQYAAVHPRDWRFEIGQWGKPYVAGNAPELEFNLSHTAGFVVCAVSDEGAVGVDVEQTNRRVEATEIARRFFAQEEVRQIDRLDGEPARGAFFRIWTLKEAYMKALGRGFDLPLKDFWFVLTDGEVQGPAGWKFWEFSLEGEYRMALAGKGSEPRIRDARELMDRLWRKA